MSKPPATSCPSPGRIALIASLVLVVFVLAGVLLYRLTGSLLVTTQSAPVAPNSSANASRVQPRASTGVRRADFRRDHPSRDARRIADWVVASSDNGNMPFVIVDKKHAVVYAFDSGGRLTGSAPALLGITKGDEAPAGIGEQHISEMTVAERITEAGRFVAELGRSTRGEDVLWVDYDNALSMHRVLRTNPKERREQRLATPTIKDNRISYGCINVPVSFYEQVIRPAFLHSKGIVYVLPEVKSLAEVFPGYAAATRATTHIMPSSASPPHAG